MSMNIAQSGADLIKPFYQRSRAAKGYINFVQEHDKRLAHNKKAKLTCSQNTLEHLFDSECWKPIKTGNGHANYQSKVFKEIHCGYKAHGNSEVNHNHLQTIVENMDEAVTIFFDRIVERPKNLAPQETPDWNKARANYEELIQGNNSNSLPKGNHKNLEVHTKKNAR